MVYEKLQKRKWSKPNHLQEKISKYPATKLEPDVKLWELQAAQ